MRRVANRRGAPAELSEALAFGELFAAHAQAVYSFCARRSADLALAEDLTSVTYLEAWRHRDRMPSAPDEHALPWLLGVANNVVRNARRGRGRYRAFLERLPGPPAVAPAEEQAVARSVTEAGLRAAREAISALPEREQEVVVLVLWSDLTYDQAAAALGIPVGTVRSRLSRARATLRTVLTDPADPVLEESS